MAKRRHKGSGTIFKNKAGNYVYKYTMPNGKKKTRSLNTKDRSKAQDRVTDIEKELHMFSHEEVFFEKKYYTRPLRNVSLNKKAIEKRRVRGVFDEVFDFVPIAGFDIG